MKLLLISNQTRSCPEEHPEHHIAISRILERDGISFSFLFTRPIKDNVDAYRIIHRYGHSAHWIIIDVTNFEMIYLPALIANIWHELRKKIICFFPHKERWDRAFSQEGRHETAWPDLLEWKNFAQEQGVEHFVASESEYSACIINQCNHGKPKFVIAA